MLDKMCPKKLFKKVKRLNEQLDEMKRTHTDACFGFGSGLSSSEKQDYNESCRIANNLIEEFWRRKLDHQLDYHPHLHEAIEC